ncbi:hypothetical protein B1992_09960 [Pseudoxanthomonas broegbernensis]|uniref:Sugar lactone lactonase YvrE n=1 Tax=Pseudoxanthomonas broegbernensis TaxID=83619 RepID=A0A7V8GLQ8_9GAMM|nr:hypothetical protein [Pseudoxanthomonas broegbernensis]KAF1686018.1 hypothetical protein B1992_09960 [Pseudoxanthomonas broegbernensis]MBB6063725.1 sugar lactone lactonase YvrE [Pseudoxanthomonas broegbernensis]
MNASIRTRALAAAAALALAGPVLADTAPAHAAGVAAVPLWEATGLLAPESVVFDAGRDRFYVSNMATWGEGAVPGDGFVSLLDGQGRVLEREWVTGLENPKGLALANGRLYVADDDDLVEIDPDAGAILARHAPADGPGRFNDCTADPDGNVYVFSGRLDTVFRLAGGRFEPWAEVDTARTGKPNGLRAERDRLLLGSWVVPGPDGDQEGHISTVAYADRALGRIGTVPIGHIDGIEPDGLGGYTVTDWTRGHVIHLTADGEPTRLFTLPKGAADHHYVVDRQLLVVPLLLDHAVRAYRWAPDPGRD